MAKKEKGITIIQLWKECSRQINAGNGNRHIMISSDDEGNGFHELFYGFSGEIDFTEPWTQGMLPYGVTPEEAKKDYITLG